MPKIKPISDLRNYTEVLRDVSAGGPVFLTKNGRGRFAIMDIDDYETMHQKLKLLQALAAGERDIEQGKLYSEEEVEAYCRKKIESYGK